jgi:hypothetical protein
MRPAFAPQVQYSILGACLVAGLSLVACGGDATAPAQSPDNAEASQHAAEHADDAAEKAEEKADKAEDKADKAEDEAHKANDR